MGLSLSLGLGIGLTFSIVICALLGYFCYTTSRNHYESAPYTVVIQEGHFEIRDYPALTVVETPMQAGDNQGFRRLFKFITGSNERQQNIAMTTPVFFTNNSSQGRMAFVMPKDMRPELVPKPSTGMLEVSEYPPGRFAVMRFNGFFNSSSRDFHRAEQEKIDRLREWIGTKEQIDKDQKPIFSVFDSPWTPAIMRRNEVMIRLLIK